MNSDFFNNLSSYSEYVLKCTIVGSPLNDPEILKNLYKVEDYYWFVADGHFCFIDKNGNEAKNVIIKNNFSCSDCNSLTSLKGAPQEVGRDFFCSNCTSLTSLNGAPQKVGRDFVCSNCNSLTSLEGAPKEVSGDFSCSYCTSLTSLEGAPQKVRGDFYCSNCTSLTSLKEAPKEVGRNFICSNCNSLTSLEGAPQKVRGDFYCSNCTSLTSLNGAPQKVGRDFGCHNCVLLTSLEGATQKVSGNFICSNCNSLTSLEGAPQKVGRDFECHNCTSLTSLNGAPKEVGGDFNCNYCTSLTSLEGAPQKVGGDFTCYNCTSLTSLNGAPQKVGRDFVCSSCTSPYNKVVVSWHETKLNFLGVRDNSTLQETYFSDHALNKIFNVPKVFPLKSIDDCVKAAEKLDCNNEGFVVCDKNFNRVKVKSPTYVALHHMKNNNILSYARGIEIVRGNELDEVLTYFPEFANHLQKIKADYEAFVAELMDTQAKLDTWIDSNGFAAQKWLIQSGSEKRKDLAIWVMSNIKKFSGFAFGYVDEKIKDVSEYLKSQTSDKLAIALGYKD